MEELEQGPGEHVAGENARRKAARVAERYPRSVVLGVDTIVLLDGTIYGKPADPVQARETLEALSGRTHEVISGVCVVDSGELLAATANTSVQFRSLDERLSTGTSTAASGASAPGDTRSRGVGRRWSRRSTGTT